MSTRMEQLKRVISRLEQNKQTLKLAERFKEKLKLAGGDTIPPPSPVVKPPVSPQRMGSKKH